MTTRHRDVAAAILSGGGATRMGGRVKALIEIDGETIVARQLRVLSSRFEHICISANDPAPYAHLGLPVVADRETGQGPLAGISAALHWCPVDWLLVVAGDMPHLSCAAIDLLLGARTSEQTRAATVEVGGRPEPMFALYHRSSVALVDELIATGRRRASGLLTAWGHRTAMVPESAVRAIDPELGFLANINTPDDVS